MRLVETVLALTLGALLLAGAWRGAAGLRRTAADLETRAVESDARRVVGLLMDLDAGGVMEDGVGDEVAVRAWRWWALPCPGGAAPDAAEANWAGLRRPDPAKDSVHLIDARGRSRVRRLTRVGAADGCGGEGIRLEWEAVAGDPGPVMVRGFERGAYTLDTAFRYRRGAGGAQPLTAPVFDPDSVELRAGPGGLVVRLGRGPARRWTW